MKNYNYQCAACHQIINEKEYEHHITNNCLNKKKQYTRNINFNENNNNILLKTNLQLIFLTVIIFLINMIVILIMLLKIKPGMKLKKY